jgi:hypothetical protein
MNQEMRQKLAREPFAEKIRKVGQLIRLAKTFPRRPSKPLPAAEHGLPEEKALKKGMEQKAREFNEKGGGFT